MTCNRIAAAKNGDNTLYSVGLSANILLNVFVIYMNVLAIITAVQFKQTTRGMKMAII